MSATIMIVEDHDAVRGHLVDWLRMSFPACRILDVNSAEEALRVADSDPLDVVIMDIRLPRMNGLEAARRIKAQQPKSRIVVLSLYDDLVQRTRASGAGVSAFVSKQRMHAELLPVLETLLPRRARHAPRRETGEAAEVKNGCRG